MLVMVPLLQGDFAAMEHVRSILCLCDTLMVMLLEMMLVDVITGIAI